MYSKFQPVKVKPIQVVPKDLGHLPSSELVKLLDSLLEEEKRLAAFKARIKRMRTRG